MFILVLCLAHYELISCRDGSELSTRDLQKMVQALPQYSEQIEKLSLHVDVSGPLVTAAAIGVLSLNHSVNASS